MSYPQSSAVSREKCDFHMTRDTIKCNNQLGSKGTHQMPRKREDRFSNQPGNSDPGSVITEAKNNSNEYPMVPTFISDSVCYTEVQ